MVMTLWMVLLLNSWYLKFDPNRNWNQKQKYPNFVHKIYLKTKTKIYLWNFKSLIPNIIYFSRSIYKIIWKEYFKYIFY